MRLGERGVEPLQRPAPPGHAVDDNVAVEIRARPAGTGERGDLYVVTELFAVNRKYGHTKLVMWLVLSGILLGFATDFVVSAAGV